MKKLITLSLILVIVVMGCSVKIPTEYTAHVPYCPNTDSTWAAADSVPLGCKKPEILQ